MKSYPILESADQYSRDAPRGKTHAQQGYTILTWCPAAAFVRSVSTIPVSVAATRLRDAGFVTPALELPDLAYCTKGRRKHEHNERQLSITLLAKR